MKRIMETIKILMSLIISFFLLKLLITVDFEIPIEELTLDPLIILIGLIFAAMIYPILDLIVLEITKLKKY